MVSTSLTHVPHVVVGEKGYEVYSQTRKRTSPGPYARANTRSPGLPHVAARGYTAGQFWIGRVVFESIVCSSCRECACTCTMEHIKAGNASALVAATTVSA
jgi:hypothetical protein